MKKRIVLFMLMMLCAMSVPAAAQQMRAAQSSRIHPGLPEGMVWQSITLSDGSMHIVVDTNQTDWDKVATAARVSGSLAIHPGIMKPENALGLVMRSDYFRWEEEKSSAESEARILSQFESELRANPDMGYNADPYGCSYQGWAIGRYDEGMSLFLPEGIVKEQGAGFAVCWKMEDGTYLMERIRFTLSYTQTPPVYVRRRGVPAGDIVADARTGGGNIVSSDAVLSADAGEGRIVYKLSNSAASREVFTAVAVPRWIEEDCAQAYLLSNGKESPLMMDNAGIYAQGRRSAVLFYKVGRQDCLYKKDWAIRWADAQGRTLAIYALEAEFHVGNPEFTVSYANREGDGAVPVPADHLTWTISNPMDGLSVSYQDGELLMSVDEEKLPPNRKTDLSLTTVQMQLTPPQDARACHVYGYRGDVIYGNNGESAWLLGTVDVRPGEPVVVPEFTRTFFGEYNVTLHNGKQMSYYLSSMMMGRYGGEALVFEWLNEKGQRIGSRQFIAMTSDAYALAVERNPSETKNPNKAVAIPTVQMDTELTVETAELPQKGDNVVRYEIALLDGYGNKAQPEGSVLLYLPYPDAKTMEECAGYAFAVYHQLTDGSYEEFSTENGRLTLTPMGLCMEATSFSPYYLNWEEGADAGAAALPQTGDSSNLGLYMLMLGAACAFALGSMRGKADRNNRFI